MVKIKTTRLHAVFLCLTLILGLSACSPDTSYHESTGERLQLDEILDRPFSRLKDDWPQSISDIAPDPRAKFGRLENGLRYVILPVPDEKGAVSIQLNISAGFNDEPEGLYGIAHLLEHMAFRGARSDNDGSIIHDLQSVGVRYGEDLNGFTRTHDTLYYLNLPSEGLSELDTALKNISQFVRVPRLSLENMQAEKKIVLAELNAHGTISNRAQQDFRQFQFPDQLREKISGAGTKESLNAIELSDVEAFYEAHYIPEKVLLVVAGDVKTSRMEKSIHRLFSDWTSNIQLAKNDNLKTIELADFPATASFSEIGAKTQINAIENLASTLRNDVFETRQKLFTEEVGLSILQNRLNKITTDDDKVSWISPFKSRYPEYDIRGFLSSAKNYPQMMRYFEKERLRIIKYGFTEDEIAYAINSKRANLERLAERPEVINSWHEVWRISADFAAGKVYNSRQQNLENFETFAEKTSSKDFHAAAKDMWSGFNPRYWTKSSTPITAILDKVMDIPEAVSKLDIENLETANPSEFRLKVFPETGVVISRDKVASNSINRLLYKNGVRLNFQQRTEEVDDIKIIVKIQSDLPEIIDRYGFISEQVNVLSQSDIKGANKEDIDKALVGKKIEFNASFGRGKIELSSSTRPEDLSASLGFLATFISEVDLNSKYHAEALDIYIAQSDIDSEGSALTAGSYKIHYVYADNSSTFSSYRSGATPAEMDVRRDIQNIFDSGAIEVGVVGDFEPELLEQGFAKSLGALPVRKPKEPAPIYQTHDIGLINPGLSTITYNGTKEQMALFYCWPRVESKTVEDDMYWRLSIELMRNRINESLRETFGLIYAPISFKQSNPVFPDAQYSCFGVQIEPDAELQAHMGLMGLVAEFKSLPIMRKELDRAIEPLKTYYRKNNDLNHWRVWGVAEAYSAPDRIDEFRDQERVLKKISLKKTNKKIAPFFERDKLHIFRVQNDGSLSERLVSELKVKSHFGDTESQYKLGNQLLNDPSEAEQKIAVELLDKLARDGHENAITKLANYHRARKQNMEKAAYYLEFSTQSPKNAWPNMV